jgi:hypothetical protein
MGDDHAFCQECRPTVPALDDRADFRGGRHPLHKSPPPQQLPSNPWIKPAKPETFGEKFRGLVWRENKPKEPKDWLNQKRLE